MITGDIDKMTDVDWLNNLLAEQELYYRDINRDLKDYETEARGEGVEPHLYPDWEAVYEEAVWTEHQILKIKRRLAQLRGEH